MRRRKLNLSGKQIGISKLIMKKYLPVSNISEGLSAACPKKGSKTTIEVQTNVQSIPK